MKESQQENMQEEKQIFNRAWKLFEHTGPEGWIKHWFSLDKNKTPVHPKHPSAVCWCAAGAITKVYPSMRLDEKIKMLNSEVVSYAIWNDASTFTEVLAILKKLDL